jgi:hypothetical protein
MAMPDCVKIPYCSGKAISLHEVELEHSCSQQLSGNRTCRACCRQSSFHTAVAFLQSQPG